MGLNTTKPIKEVSRLELLDKIKNKEIRLSDHALDHLSENQRKVFKEEELINMLKREYPRKTYLQQNGRYGVYYRRSDGYRKLILAIEDKVTIVTFVDTDEIPKIRL